MELINVLPGQIDKDFRWRTKDGEQFLYPREMATRHLVNTLMMIWNHSMPVDARTPFYIQYNLGSYYTDSYLRQSIRQLALVLVGRKDLTAEHKRKLQHMLDYLKRHQLEDIGNVHLPL